MTTRLQLFTSPSSFPKLQRLRLFMHEKGIADRFVEHIYDMTPLDERFEHLDAYWQRWQGRAAFQAAYSDGSSGVPELDRFHVK
jgi:glutathione S-transferase